MTPLTTNGRNLSRKTAEMLSEFRENGLSEDRQILQTYREQLAHKPPGYNITSCFRSAAKCSEMPHKSA